MQMNCIVYVRLMCDYISIEAAKAQTTSLDMCPLIGRFLAGLPNIHTASIRNNRLTSMPRGCHNQRRSSAALASLSELPFVVVQNGACQIG